MEKTFFFILCILCNIIYIYRFKKRDRKVTSYGYKIRIDTGCYSDLPNPDREAHDLCLKSWRMQTQSIARSQFG